MKITVSIVIYNSNIQDLESALSSYAKSLSVARPHYLLESFVYIVNNNPEDDYQDLITLLCQKNNLEFNYIQSQRNGGYGYGNNLAIKRAESDYHIVLNPDVIFNDDVIKNSLDFLEKNLEFVLLTPAVYGKNGERHYLCKKNPALFHLFLRRFASQNIRTNFFKNYLDRFEYRNFSYDDPIENVPYCTGCFMFFRTTVLKNLGGFDERFFLYSEDADLSRRTLAYGKTIYLPTVKIVHAWHKGSHKNKKLRNEAIKSAFKYWWKWGGIF